MGVFAKGIYFGDLLHYTSFEAFLPKFKHGPPMFARLPILYERVSYVEAYAKVFHENVHESSSQSDRRCRYLFIQLEATQRQTDMI